MNKELAIARYVDYKVYNITKIKSKYGFRVVLILEGNTKRVVQHSGFEKKEQAEKERCKVISQLENRSYVVYTDVTVKTYMEYWFDYKAPKRLNSYNSFMSYRNVIFNHIIPRIGNIKLTKLTCSMIEKLYKDVNAYSSNICELVQVVMKGSLSDAKIDMFIPTNEALSAKIPKNDKEIEKKVTTKSENTFHTLTIDERKTFTLEQVATIIKASKNTPIYLHVLFAALMGLRKSEINGIKYSDIDFINRKLKIEVQLRETYE